MPFPVQKDYRCCNRHLDYPTPVIGTVKFTANEFWCPHCGANYQMFDGFKYYPINYRMSLRYHMFCKLSLAYLSDKTETYTFEERPDAIFALMTDADIALTLFNLAYRHTEEDIVDGAVLYTHDKQMIKIITLNGELFMQSPIGKQKPAINVKQYDWALLPTPYFAADFFIKSMGLL